VNRRRRSPRTRQFNEREIRRRHEIFKRGMLRQEDTEGTEVTHGLANCVNARSYGPHIEGRPGTLLFSGADFGVSITNGADADLAAALASGSLYAAAGAAKAASTVPTAGQRFVVYGTGDTAAGELALAKGGAVRIFDVFIVRAPGEAAYLVEYLGSLQNPAMPGFGDTVATEITATQFGNTITWQEGPKFTAALAGHYFSWFPSGQAGVQVRAFIRQVLSDTTLDVDTSVAIPGPGVSARIERRVNGIHQHRATDTLIGVFGGQVYRASTVFAGWTKVVGLSDGTLADDLDTRVYEFGDDILITNSGGQFVVTGLGTDYVHYYQINTPIPTDLMAGVPSGEGKPHRHKYTFTCTRLSRMSNRLDEDTQLIRETGSVKAGEDRVDWAEVWTSRPIGDAVEAYGQITGKALAAEYQSHTGYTGITGGQFKLNVNSTAYEVTVDLSSARDMRDVEIAIQAAARVHRALKDVEFIFEGTRWRVRTGLNDEIGVCTAGASTGTNLHTILGLDTGASTLSLAATYPVTVGPLTYPALTRDITHYSVYRGEDSAEDDASGDLLGLVEDVPVARAFTAEIIANTTYEGHVILLNDTAQKLYRADVGSTIKLLDGTVATITELADFDGEGFFGVPFLAEANAAMTDATAPKASQSAAIGGGLVFTAAQDGTAFALSAGALDAVRDTEHLVFWADGTTGILSQVVNTALGRMLEPATKAPQAITMHPVSRYFTDTVKADQARAVRGAWPLQTRFWEPLPSEQVTAVTPGWIFVAKRGSGGYAYSQLNNRWNAGYYNPAHQKYTQFWDGVQSFRVKDGYVLIRGTSALYRLATASWTDVGEARVGEVVAKLADPKELSKIGGSLGDGAAQDLESGGEIVVTSEPEVRIWDGEKYSAGMSAGRVRKSDLLKARLSFVGAYQAISGYFLWFKKEAGTNAPGDLQGLATSSGRCCLHLGLKNEQGLWWSEITDGDWVWPESQGCVCDLIDDQGQSLLVVWDERTGRPFVLNPREGPSNSRLDASWEDKLDLNRPASLSADTAPGAGTAIPATVRFAEDYGEERNFDVEHGETHITLRPVKANNRGASGYTGEGLPNAFVLSAKSYLEGNPVAAVTIDAIDTTTETVYGRILRARTIQHEFITTTSEWRLMGINSYYTAMDKAKLAGSGTRPSSADYARAFSAPTIWLTRGGDLLLNRMDLRTIPGTVTPAPGPDGRSNSAMLITDEIALAEYDLQRTRIITLWSTSAYVVEGISSSFQYTFDTLVTGGVTWYLRYTRFGMGGDIALPAGTVFDVRVFPYDPEESAPLPTSTPAMGVAAMRHYFNSVKEDSGRQYLPR
jgi:hypothetical protein